MAVGSTEGPRYYGVGKGRDLVKDQVGCGYKG